MCVYMYYNMTNKIICDVSTSSFLGSDYGGCSLPTYHCVHLSAQYLGRPASKGKDDVMGYS